jgi:hypothetical protein
MSADPTAAMGLVGAFEARVTAKVARRFITRTLVDRIHGGAEELLLVEQPAMTRGRPARAALFICRLSGKSGYPAAGSSPQPGDAIADERLVDDEIKVMSTTIWGPHNGPAKRLFSGGLFAGHYA